MYNAHVLPTNLPVKVIGMNSSISTPFDRQSTVNKSIERWCERTRRKWRVQGGLYMCVFIRQVSDSFLFCCPITFGVNIYTKISTNHLLQISLFYLSLNPPITRSIHEHWFVYIHKKYSSWSAFRVRLKVV